MKYILAVVFTSLFTLTACAKEESAKAAPVAAVAEAVKEVPKTKQVCKDSKGKDGKVIKNKDGSAKQVCKTIKIHKKHEGTKVPDGKKK